MGADHARGGRRQDLVVGNCGPRRGLAGVAIYVALAKGYLREHRAHTTD